MIEPKKFIRQKISVPQIFFFTRFVWEKKLNAINSPSNVLKYCINNQKTLKNQNMSDFEDFEDLFDKEAETIQRAQKQVDLPSEDEFQQEDIIEDEEIDYSKYTDNLELEEYLKRKINHLCINLSTANLKNEYDINANTLKNLKQLKKGLTFDTKVLESRLI